jgi:Fe-S-cluster containining protein
VKDQSLNEKLEEVQQVYADLARRPIERNCTRITECCQFKLTGQTPYLTKGEALLVAKAFRATGRKVLTQSVDGVCPMFNRENGHCLVYAARPFGCRTHFCAAAGGPYARREVIDLIRRLEDIDVALKGEGPIPLPRAVTDALKQLDQR